MATDVEGVDVVAEKVYQEARAWRDNPKAPVAQFSWFLPEMDPVTFDEAQAIATYINRKTGGLASDFIAAPVRVGYTNLWRVSADCC
jgi:hypothetical protein